MAKTKVQVHHKQMAKKNSQTPVKSGQSRMDGWQSLLTGLGTKKDKRTSNTVQWDARTQQFFEELYAGDELAAKIVNCIPEDGLRKWVNWVGVEKPIATKIEARCKQLDMRKALQKTWIWARVYGGACLYIVTDTDKPSLPLNPSRERVLGLRDLSRWDLRVLTTDVESDFGSPNFGRPNVYYLNVQMGSAFKGYPIHWTRMVRFDGALLPRRTYIQNNYWHDSILNKLFNSIRNYQTSNDAGSSILQDFNIGIYKMKNLAALMAAGKEDIVKARMELLHMSKSTIKALILDSDDEEFVDLSRNVSGLAEMLAQQANRLVAATDLPHTKLLGESPDGSNSTGNSTMHQWYDFVQSEQENELRPKIEQLRKAVFPDIPDLDFEFKSLWQLDELEEADRRNKQANTDQLYISSGVLDPSEVATSRFGGDTYSTETQLDKEARALGLIGPGSNEAENLFPGQEENPDDDPNSTPPPAADGGQKSQPQKTLQNLPKRPNLANLGNPGDLGTEGPVPASLNPDSTPNPQGLENDRPGTQFDMRNETIQGREKIKPFISQTMSEPMRDPKTDPPMKAPGVPSTPRVITPSLGNGITAQDVKKKVRLDSLTNLLPPKSATSIAVLSDNRILLGRRKDTGKWTLPGGGIQFGETPRQGAEREMLEETGINSKRLGALESMGFRTVARSDGGAVEVHMFKIETAQTPATGILDPDQEVSEWKWVEVRDLAREDMRNNMQHSPNVVLESLGFV